ncbi:uncharacterized protein [Phyllobates terribilis]|uniref:uncharacterized protein n=1 Tax=Phyllobates terribilis TaxID=111132 RepID=UPI003CCA7339
MAARYKKLSKDALIDLCEQRGIETADRSKEMLMHNLAEHELAQNAEAAGQRESPPPIGPEMPVLAPEMSSEGASNASSEEPVDFTLQMALQQLGASDPALRLQLVLQYREAAERRAEKAAAERRAEREAAAAERQAEREFKLRIAQVERGSNLQLTPSQDINPRRPRLENFPVMEKDTDLDTFLRGFEKTCKQYHLPLEQWALYLAPGLRGKAAEVFVDLPSDLDGNYEAIKEALVRKYNLTPEVYRRKFRNLQRGSADSYADFVSTLRSTFHQWIRGLSVSSFEALTDLMVKDQFLHMCPTDVRQFVCDREPQSADEAAKIADRYVANRMPEVRKPSGFSWKGGTDLGRMVSHYIPPLNVNATEKVEARVPPETLCQEGKCTHVQDCTYVAVVTRSQSAAQTQPQRLEDASQIELPEQEGPPLAQEPPHMPDPPRSLTTDPEDSASDQRLVFTLGQGLQTDSQSFQETLLEDASLEKLQCRADQPPTASDKERIYWETLPIDNTEHWDCEKRLVVPYLLGNNYSELLMKFLWADTLEYKKLKLALLITFIDQRWGRM